MTYYYVVYYFSADCQSGQGSFYSIRNDNNPSPSEWVEQIKQKFSNLKSVVIANWIEVTKEVFEQETGKNKDKKE